MRNAWETKPQPGTLESYVSGVASTGAQEKLVAWGRTRVGGSVISNNPEIPIRAKKKPNLPPQLSYKGISILHARSIVHPCPTKQRTLDYEPGPIFVQNTREIVSFLDPKKGTRNYAAPGRRSGTSIMHLQICLGGYTEYRFVWQFEEKEEKEGKKWVGK